MQNKEIFRAIIDAVQTLLEDKDFKIAYRIGKHFTRNRKLTFKKLFYFLFFQSKKSLSINIEDFIEDYPQLKIGDISKQAVSKARKGICFRAFIALLKVTYQMFYRLSQNIKKWNGYKIFAIDGTTLQMPQTEENLAEFGFTTNQTGSRFPLAGASALMDVLNDLIIDAQINTRIYPERDFALEHMAAFSELDMKKDSIILFDRGYPSYKLFHKLNQEGIFYLMRISNYSQIKRLLGDSDDKVISYGRGTYAKYRVNVRMLKIILENGKTEYLITNVFDDSLTPDMFKELYHLRWGIEIKYQELKSRLEIESFSGHKPQIIRQDYYLALFFSNLVAILKKDIDLMIEKETDTASKPYSYQCNRSFLINRIKKYLVKMLLEPQNLTELLDNICVRASKMRSQIRNQRKYERKVRHPRRKYNHNRKSCI